MLGYVKSKQGLKIPGICCILCDCGKVCVDQTDRTIETKCREHMRHVLATQRSLVWWSTAL
jgi:hypothetical protein